MLRATEVLAAGEWKGKPADIVELDFDGRTRRRIKLQGTGGLAFLLDLPAVPNLRKGDGLLLDDGRIIAVEAAAEPLLEISCPEPQLLARVAWHLGNRHLAAEIAAGLIHIRDDHVMAAMVRGLGAEVRVVSRPFNPEGGAYARGEHGHGHRHAHDGDHHH